MKAADDAGHYTVKDRRQARSNDCQLPASHLKWDAPTPVMSGTS